MYRNFLEYLPDFLRELFDPPGRLRAQMTKGGHFMNTTQFLRGMGIGVAVGAALSMAVAPQSRFHKKSAASKAIRAASQVAEHIADSMGL